MAQDWMPGTRAGARHDNLLMRLSRRERSDERRNKSSCQQGLIDRIEQKCSAGGNTPEAGQERSQLTLAPVCVDRIVRATRQRTPYLSCMATEDDDWRLKPGTVLDGQFDCRSIAKTRQRFWKLKRARTACG